MAATNPTPGRRRVDSWKEIAAFFDRDERTVNRWEKERGLPVRRHPGTKGRVYAYVDELSAWLASPRNEVATVVSTDEASAPFGTQDSRLFVVPGAGSSGATPTASGPSYDVGPDRAGPYRKATRLAALALPVFAVIAAVAFIHPTARRTSIKATAAQSLAERVPAAPAVLASTLTHDPQAEQLYLKGRYYWNKRTPEDLNKALDYFTQAVVHDPNYAQAYVGLADCYNLLREYTLMPSSEAYPRALAAARRAVELDGQSGEAHASLAFVTFFGMWDVAGGEREFRRAIDLNPNHAATHHWYATALLALHRYSDALAEIDRAQTLDPASSSILADKGDILVASGRREEALALLLQMERREPAFLSPHLYLKSLYLENHQYPEFLSELRQEAALRHDAASMTIAVAAEKGLKTRGAQGMRRSILRVQKELYAQGRFSPTELARTSALLGNNEEAMSYLTAAYEQRDELLLFLETIPEFNRLHHTPAYLDLAGRMHLPPQVDP